MFGIDDEYSVPWTPLKWSLIVFFIFMGAMGYFMFSSYSLVKNGPKVNWIPRPFTMEQNAQGQNVAAIFVGLDEKGYVRWTRQDISQPIAAPAAPAPTPSPTVVNPIKPEVKNGNPPAAKK